MKVHKAILYFVLFFGLTAPSMLLAQTQPLGEKEKIESLINLVSQLKTAKFSRNGWTYSADTAATFLRLKWQANNSAIKTARDFIDRVASTSGTSGKPYLVRLQDGTEMKSRDFLLGELKKIETAIADRGVTGG